MMNSLSENHFAKTRLQGAVNVQAGLLSGGSTQKEITRIEFYPVEGSRPTVNEIKPGTQDGDLSKQLQDMEVDSAAERLREESINARIDAAQREARMRAREEWENELVQCLAEEKTNLLRVCQRFSRERSRYFADVEAEVVKLALAIATRVLHRETQFDPLLLSATVRVALEKLADTGGVVIRVPSKDIAAWRGVIEATAHSGIELVGDERIEVADCVLDTKVGKVELGVAAQLEEIERGFFDLLQRRPS